MLKEKCLNVNVKMITFDGNSINEPLQLRLRKTSRFAFECRWFFLGHVPRVRNLQPIWCRCNQIKQMNMFFITYLKQSHCCQKHHGPTLHVDRHGMRPGRSSAVTYFALICSSIFELDALDAKCLSEVFERVSARWKFPTFLAPHDLRCWPEIRGMVGGLILFMKLPIFKRDL